jgi:hypothetical protein
MYEKSNLHSFKVIKASASNILAQRVKELRLDLTRGRDYEVASDSIFVRAISVVSQKGLMSTGVFLKENSNG